MFFCSEKKKKKNCAENVFWWQKSNHIKRNSQNGFFGQEKSVLLTGVAAKMFPENRHTIKGTCYGCYAVPGGNKKRVNSWKLKVEVLGVYCSSRDFPSLKLTARTWKDGLKPKKRKVHLPTINFHGELAVSFREGIFRSFFWRAHQCKMNYRSMLCEAQHDTFHQIPIQNGDLIFSGRVVFRKPTSLNW